MWLYLAQVIRGCGCFFLQKNYSCSVSQRNLQHVRLIKLPAYTSVAHPTSSTKSVVKRVTLIFPREKIDCIHVTLHRMWAHAPAAVLCVCVCRVAVETWSLCTHELVCVMESKWLAFFTWIPIPHFTHVRHVKSTVSRERGQIEGKRENHSWHLNPPILTNWVKGEDVCNPRKWGYQMHSCIYLWCTIHSYAYWCTYGKKQANGAMVYLL